MMSRIAFAALAISMVAVMGCPEPCSVASDCPDDGNFCTGARTCTDGVCGFSGDPCEDTASPVCDEESNSCVECDINADCNDGLFCNGTETCAANNACVAGVNPCDPGEVCDEETNTCEVAPCEVAADCPDDGLFCTGDPTCTDGVCSFSGDPCAGTALPACDEEGDACVECVADEDCAEGEVCDENNVCMVDTNGGDPVAGAAFYVATCQVCHGPEGAGMGAFPNIQNQSAAALQATVEGGGHPMYTVTAEDYANLEAFLATP